MARNSHITASHPLPWSPVNSPCVAGPEAPARAVQGPPHTRYLTCGEDAPSEFRVMRVTLLPMFWLPDCPQLETESLASDPLSPSSLWLSSWPGTFTTMVFCRRPGTALRGNRDTGSVVRAARQHAETVLHARPPTSQRDAPQHAHCTTSLPAALSAHVNSRKQSAAPRNRRKLETFEGSEITTGCDSRPDTRPPVTEVTLHSTAVGVTATSGKASADSDDSPDLLRPRTF